MRFFSSLGLHLFFTSTSMDCDAGPAPLPQADVVPAEGEEGEAPPAEAEGEEGEVPVSEPWNGMKKPMGIALARDGPRPGHAGDNT